MIKPHIFSTCIGVVVLQLVVLQHVVAVEGELHSLSLLNLDFLLKKLNLMKSIYTLKRAVMVEEVVVVEEVVAAVEDAVADDGHLRDLPSTFGINQLL